MAILPNLASHIARSEGDPKILSTGPSSLGASDQLARGLGWFSLALGAAELIAPHQIGRALGMEGKEALIRAYGVREIMAGMLTLSVDKRAGLWSRVGGDGLDIATLLPGLHAHNPKRDNVALALAMVAGITALDIVALQANSARHSRKTASPDGSWNDYSERSGFPHGIADAKGKARADFQTPPDMKADLDALNDG